MTAFAGIATTIMTLAAFAIFAAVSPPTGSDPAADVATFFRDHQTAMYIVIWIAASSLVTDLVLLTGVREVFRRRAPEQDMLTLLGFVSGLAFLSVLFVGLAIVLQLAYRHGSSDPGLQRSSLDLYSLMTTMSGAPLALSVTASSLALMRGQVVPSWIGWYGFVVAAVHIVSMGSLAHDGFFTPDTFGGVVAPLVLETWVLGVSILLLRTAKTSAMSPRRVREHSATA